jgi:hypothetical protein
MIIGSILIVPSIYSILCPRREINQEAGKIVCCIDMLCDFYSSPDIIWVIKEDEVSRA